MVLFFRNGEGSIMEQNTLDAGTTRTEQTPRRAWSKPTIMTAEVSVVTKNGTNIAHPNFADSNNTFYSS